MDKWPPIALAVYVYRASRIEGNGMFGLTPALHLLIKAKALHNNALHATSYVRAIRYSRIEGYGTAA